MVLPFPTPQVESAEQIEIEPIGGAVLAHTFPLAVDGHVPPLRQRATFQSLYDAFNEERKAPLLDLGPTWDRRAARDPAGFDPTSE
jgi:hypothetical protein